ncbi:MAG: ACP S-malonyltransferase, partial [Candidatus Rokubacteria bacterium]|nr:ACP S-malonyltransferase [Candidatus Rokubacteria bacterium]
EEVCAEAAQGEVVGVANINSPGQIVIAGHRGAVERAVRGAAARGGRKSVILPVSAPFHSALMKPAADRLAVELDSVQVLAPRIPVARNVDAGLTTTADEVKPFLVRQVQSPVRWTDCLERLAREGITVYVEVGPGRVLTGLLKRNLDGTRGLAVEDPASLEKTLAALTLAALTEVGEAQPKASRADMEIPRAERGGEAQPAVRGAAEGEPSRMDQEARSAPSRADTEIPRAERGGEESA